ncbi:MAG: endonuclease [Clostridiales bacterium]|nr:endonuclease [Clostridiales bacterium]
MKTRIKIAHLLLAVLTASITLAAIPAGYYDDAAGLSGTSLRQALHNIIDGHTEKSYDYAWTAFASTDIRTSLGSDYIWCMYTEQELHHDEDQQGKYTMDQYITYNREHSWPKSWANESYPHYTDLYHLYPTQANSNTNRNNLPYGEVETATYTTANGTQKGDARAGLGYVGTVFEPIDEYKGDLARTYFYISTRYYTEDSGWNTSPMTNKSELLEWAVDMLLDWHNNDPVSQKELDRIEAVYAIQGNRNPFIDHPEYVDSIWNAASASIAAPAAQTASSIGTDRFTANWTSVATATGYKLYVSEQADFTSYISSYGPKDVGNNLSEVVSSLSSSRTYYYRVRSYKDGSESSNSNSVSVTTSTPASVGDGGLFFSEYIEGSSNNKALEIYNASAEVIDLSDVDVKLYSNDGTSPSSTATLSGSLANAEVYVLANGLANAAILSEADITSGVVNFNGNDAIELYFQDTLIDIIGTVGSSSTFAENVTLVRKPEVISGNTTYTASEWNSYSEDETSYLGSHTANEVPTAISLSEFIANYESGSVILQWTTASETENATFQIFRNNEFIASIEGSGTTSVAHNYEYIDKFVTPGRTYTYILNDIDYSGQIRSHENMSVSVSIPSDGQLILPEGSIGDVYPNPFNPIAILPINLIQDTDVRIFLYDILGQKCRDVLSGNYAKGDYRIPINARDLPSGAYVLHIQMGLSKQTQKIILSK